MDMWFEAITLFNPVSRDPRNFDQVVHLRVYSTPLEMEQRPVGVKYMLQLLSQIILVNLIQ